MAIAPNHTKLISDFFTKYGEFIFRLVKPCELEPLTGDDLKFTCVHGKNSSAGMDQWAPEDLALISDQAFHHLAMMLNAIEQGASRPTHLLHAKNSWLANDPDAVCDALNHR